MWRSIVGAMLLLLSLAMPGAAQVTGEVSVQAGAAFAPGAEGVTPSGVGPAIEGSIGARFGHVSTLLEAGFFGAGSDRRAVRYGVGVRGVIGNGAWRPYLVGGFGGYADSWTGDYGRYTTSWFGVNAGAGVQRSLGSGRASLYAESRVHVRTQRIYSDEAVNLEFVTLSAGIVTGWWAGGVATPGRAAPAAPSIAQQQALASLGLRSGQRVRIAMPGEGRVAGTVQPGEGDGLVLLTESGLEGFPSLPDTLWVQKRAWLPGLLSGAAVGVVLGALAGYAVHGLCEYDCDHSPAADAVVGALLVGTSGAALGTLVGAAIPAWKRTRP